MSGSEIGAVEESSGLLFVGPVCFLGFGLGRLSIASPFSTVLPPSTVLVTECTAGPTSVGNLLSMPTSSPSVSEVESALATFPCCLFCLVHFAGRQEELSFSGAGPGDVLVE